MMLHSFPQFYRVFFQRLLWISSVFVVLWCDIHQSRGGDLFETLRERMVRDDIAGGGIQDLRVIESMRVTLRHEFMPIAQRDLAYFDMGVPIGEAQTISGAFVVAYMTEKLETKPTDTVLEIGTGSGYQAAVLSPLVKTVYSIEINKVLGRRAKLALDKLGYRNVITTIGDGFQGWKEHAPFDKIIVTCSPENVPTPLVAQLAEGGRMIIPVGERYDQTLLLLVKRNGTLVEESLCPSLFVPMTGAAEDGRRVLPDGNKPALHNGSFENRLKDLDIPESWYYGRQITLHRSPDGNTFLQLTNEQPSRPSQVFQGFSINGRVVDRLTIRVSLRGEEILGGPYPDQIPGICVQFFDEKRSRTSRDRIGPWKGSFDWKEVQGSISVPLWANEAILQIGLLGATGRLDVDDISIEGRKKTLTSAMKEVEIQPEK